MYYILEIDKIVLTHSEIRNYFSNSSLPKKLTDDFLKTIGVYVVSRERITNNSKTHKLIHDTKPILIDGEYTLKLIEIPLTESEIKEFKKERIRNLIISIKIHLDSVAKKNGYESIISACSYASCENAFQLESIAFVKWRSSVWEYVYEQIKLIEDDKRDEPTIYQFISELPLFSFRNKYKKSINKNCKFLTKTKKILKMCIAYLLIIPKKIYKFIFGRF